MEILVITGLSGSGKSFTSSVLEDIGFYTVDNLPAEMMTRFAAFCQNTQSKYKRLAFVYDIRADEPIEIVLSIIDDMKQQADKCNVLFLDSSSESIIRRYKETRRSHPLECNGYSLPQAIAEERNRMMPLYRYADMVLDTTAFSTAKLRSTLLAYFGTSNDRSPLQINVMSFGFKHGLPPEADMVLDVRFLPNPYYVEELKQKTGLETSVRDYIYHSDHAQMFANRTEDLLQFLLPLYQEEGKSIFVLAVGCTGGHHRSVALTHDLAQRIEKMGYTVTESHRDISR